MAIIAYSAGVTNPAPGTNLYVLMYDPDVNFVGCMLLHVVGCLLDGWRRVLGVDR